MIVDRSEHDPALEPDGRQNATSPTLDRAAIGVRPANEDSVAFHEALLPATFLASDSFVRYARPVTVEPDRVLPAEGDSLEASVLFVGTRCCFYGGFGESVTAFVGGPDDDTPREVAIAPAHGHVCFDENYGANTVRLTGGVQWLNNITTQALVPHIDTDVFRGVMLNNTWSSLHAHPDAAVLGGAYTYDADKNSFHIDVNSSINLTLPVKTSLLWITGGTGPGFGGLQVSMQPNISWEFNGNVSLESAHLSPVDGTVFMAPVRVGSDRSVVITAGSTAVDLSNILIYTQEATYTEGDADAGLVRTINILGGVAWGVAGLIVLVFLTSAFMRYRSKREKKWLDDRFDMFSVFSEDDYYGAPQVKISTKVPEAYSDKTPVSPVARKLSVSSVATRISSASSDSDYHTEDPHMAAKPLRVITADRVLRNPNMPMAPPTSTPLSPGETPESAIPLMRPFYSPSGPYFSPSPYEISRVDLTEEEVLPGVFSPSWRGSQPPTPRSPFPSSVPNSPVHRMSMRSHRSPWDEAPRRSQIITVHMS